MNPNNNDTGIVVIGRNEGLKLEKCLTSCEKQNVPIVYVDSGSCDNSVQQASELGFFAHSLSTEKPFSAARARNEGAEVLLKQYPKLDFIQFVDGDCEMIEGWLEVALQFMKVNQNVSIACGLLHEKFPEISIYNRICDLEWDATLGRIEACGGVFLIKTKDFHLVEGFTEYLIAGEEPELCSRLRAAGREIWRLDTDMAFHDSEMLKLSQWWRRGLRGGFASAESMIRFKDLMSTKNTIGSFIWVFFLLLVILASLNDWRFLFLLLIYPLKTWQISARYKHFTKRKGDALLYATHCMILKVPRAFGALRFLANYSKGKQTEIISNK